MGKLGPGLVTMYIATEFEHNPGRIARMKVVTDCAGQNY